MTFKGNNNFDLGSKHTQKTPLTIFKANLKLQECRTADQGNMLKLLILGLFAGSGKLLGSGMISRLGTSSVKSKYHMVNDFTKTQN